MVEERIIYFNEALHKYTDQFENKYTSATTKLDEYAPHTDFVAIAKACEKIGRNPNHRSYLKYRGKTWKGLLKEWGKTTDIALARGNKEHNYLEDSVKLANGFKRNYDASAGAKFGGKLYNRMYSIYDLSHGHLNGIGEVTLEMLRDQLLHIKYPDIYAIIVKLHNKGFKFYPEIVVYHPDVLISGMIDLLAVRGTDFIIIDWKTNRDPIVFKAGYYIKDNDGNVTNEFHNQDKTYKYPIAHLPYSVGHKYSLQLSLYAKFVERFGYTCKGLIIFHIQHEIIEIEPTLGITERWKTVPVKIDYHKAEIEAIVDHINLTSNNKNNQYII